MIYLLSLDQIEKRIKESTLQNLEFPEYRGLSFKEFWNKLPHKLEFFDYEEELTELYNTNKRLWIKKATGLGISEFTLRWIAWMCLKDDSMRKKQVDINVIIITGPRLELSITLMNRLKELLPGIKKTKETRCVLNGNVIECFPSHHLSAARGLNPQIVLLDEADFFPPGQQEEARHISERYIPKTNPSILMISTPNLPGGLFDNMEREESSIYLRKEMLYQIGINKVYKPEDIETAKLSPSFEREYNGKYGYGVGNIFQGIDEIVEDYDLTLKSGRKVLCIDPAYGSSKFGIIGMEKLDNLIYVKEATQYERPSPSAMLEVVIQLAKRYDNNVLVDSAHPGLIRDLQEHGVSAHGVKFGSMIDGKEKESPTSLLSIMTIEAAQAVKEKRVRINKIFKELISQLRAVQFNEKGHPDKKELTFDIGDAFLMGCNYFKTTHLSVVKI